mgnify:CR=1 FL=1
MGYWTSFCLKVFLSTKIIIKGKENILNNEIEPFSKIARQYKQQSKGYKDIGFRCAMIRMGGAAGNDDTGGNVFKEKGSKVKRRYK